MNQPYQENNVLRLTVRNIKREVMPKKAKLIVMPRHSWFWGAISKISAQCYRDSALSFLQNSKRIFCGILKKNSFSHYSVNLGVSNPKRIKRVLDTLRIEGYRDAFFSKYHSDVNVLPDPMAGYGEFMVDKIYEFYNEDSKVPERCIYAVSFKTGIKGILMEVSNLKLSSSSVLNQVYFS